MHTNRLHTQKGFTILETMVAITILIMAVTVPIGIAARGLQSSFYVKDRIIATGLAQEAFEILRSRRDDDALTGGGGPGVEWYTPIPGYCNIGSNGCDVDVRAGGYIECDTPTACVLKYDPNAITSSRRGLYTHQTGVGIVASPFTRVITLDHETTNSTDEIRVTVTVSWQSGLFASTRSVEVQGVIFNAYNAI